MRLLADSKLPVTTLVSRVDFFVRCYLLFHEVLIAARSIRGSLERRFHPSKVASWLNKSTDFLVEEAGAKLLVLLRPHVTPSI